MTPRPFRTARRLTRMTWRSKVSTWVAVTSLLGIGYGSAHVLELMDVDTPPTPTSGVVTVESITDGDTFRSSAGPVRIDNIEAPDSEARPRRCHDEALAAQATDALAALIPPGTVITLDQTGTSYGRIVALVYLDGADVGATLLAARPDLFDPYPYVGGPCPGADR